MPDREGNVLYPPGITVKPVQGGDEILASYARFTQKGYTIKANATVLPAGTVMAKETASGKYVPWLQAGTGQTGGAKGFLRKAVDATAGDKLGNIVVGGILKYSLLQYNLAGALSAAGAAVIGVPPATGDGTTLIGQLQARVDISRDWLVF